MPGYKIRSWQTFLRLNVIIIFISLIFGMLVYKLFLNFSPAMSVSANPDRFIILTLDREIPDRQTVDRLIGAGFKNIYSESSTEVYFDDFGRLESYFLDRYRDKIEPYDPRDDGYADKLRSFFVNGNKRTFYIPAGISGYNNINRRISSALQSVPFNIEIIGTSGSSFFWLILQSITVIFILGMSRDRKHLVLQIPLFLAFSAGGLSGIILCGILAGLRELMREPLIELFSRKPFGNIRERFRPYRSVILKIYLFIFIYGVFAITLNVPAIPAWTGFFCFAAVEFFSFYIEKRIKLIHNSFTPVMILPFRSKTVVFQKSMLVFALSALLGSALIIVFPGFFLGFSGENRIEFPNIPTAAEYQEHMVYETSFSYLPLGSSKGGYLHYYLGNDGLIAGTEDMAISANADFPPFALDELTRFLVDYNSRNTGVQTVFIKEWLSVALILVLYFPGRRKIRNMGKKDKVLLLRYPGIAA